MGQTYEVNFINTWNLFAIFTVTYKKCLHSTEKNNVGILRAHTAARFMIPIKFPQYYEYISLNVTLKTAKRYAI